jgi:pentose-5-phosphate-3-epimerase
MVLVMTVEPGFGGQSFMEDMMPKIAAIKNEPPASDIRSISRWTAPSTRGPRPSRVGAGANILLAGSSLFHQRITSRQSAICAWRHMPLCKAFSRFYFIPARAAGASQERRMEEILFYKSAAFSET